MNRAERRRATREGKTTDPATILWWSNSPWAPTGYGTQTAQVLRRMAADGHHVCNASNYGLEATQTVWEGIEVWPRGFDPYSLDILSAYYKDWLRQRPSKRQALITLYDTWVMLDNPNLKDIPIWSWVPIDHYPIPTKVLEWCQRPNVTPIAMSHYGSDLLAKNDIEHLCIPHGIETDIFKPTEHIEDAAGNKRTGRELLGVEEGQHVTIICNANKGVQPVRKAFAEQLMGWWAFAIDHDDAVLYMHTEKSGSMGGIDFAPLVKSIGIPEDRIKWVNQYQLRVGIPQDAMAAVFSAGDVLLAPTLGEGFGLTVAEAGACGLRQIVQDFTAQPELVVDGWTIPGQPLWDPMQAAWFSTPSVGHIAQALHESYERRDEGPSDKARQHILDNYDANTLYETGWRPMLDLL